MKNTPKCTPGNRICGRRCINENQTCLSDDNFKKYGGFYDRKISRKVSATYKNKDMTLREKDARFKKLHGKNYLSRNNKAAVFLTKERGLKPTSENIRYVNNEVRNQIGTEQDEKQYFKAVKNAKS